MYEFRVGQGFDIHPFAEGRRLVLGGIEIKHDRGLAGHSDADVLTHAIMDALLGAVGLGDIGRHFPDTDAGYRDINSLVLLKDVCGKVTGRGWRIANIDATVIAERPKIASAMARMQERLAEAAGIEPDQINIKATTAEKLGFVGREEGIAALAVALIYKSHA